MNIIDKITNSKNWWILIVFFISIGVAFAGVIKLPAKVSKLTEDVAVSQDNVQKLANTVEKYISIQATKEIEADKREQLLLKLIEQTTKKGK